MDLRGKAPTLPALLDLCAKEYGESVFLLAHDQQFNPTSITFRQFHGKVLQAAQHLREVGALKGSRCAFLFDISESAITNIIAAISLGVIVVLVNRQIPHNVLSQLFKSCQVSFVYIENSTEAELQLAHNNDIKVISNPQNGHTGHGSTPNVMLATLEVVQPSDPAVIMFTSGTTSTPKGVLHSHSNLLNAIEFKRATLESLLVPNGTVLGILPLYHVMGFTNTLLFCLYNGLQYAFFQVPVTPQLYSTAVKRVKPFTFDTVPWILEELISMCKNDPILLSHVKNLKLVSN